jgi:hypothetical protein
VTSSAGSGRRCGPAVGSRLGSSAALGLIAGRSVVEAGSVTTTGFANRLGQCCQIVFVRRGGGEAALVTNEFPTLRGRRRGRMHFTQVPRMRFVDGGERTHHCRGVGVDIRERRNSRSIAARPAASTQRSHVQETIPHSDREPIDTPRARTDNLTTCHEVFPDAEPIRDRRRGEAEESAVHCSRTTSRGIAHAPTSSTEP